MTQVSSSIIYLPEFADFMPHFEHSKFIIGNTAKRSLLSAHECFHLFPSSLHLRGLL